MRPDSRGWNASNLRRMLLRSARSLCGLVERWGTQVCADDRRYRAAKRLIARRASRCPRTRAERRAIRIVQGLGFAFLGWAAWQGLIGIQRAEERIAQQRAAEEMRRHVPAVEPRGAAPENDPQTRLVWMQSDIVRGKRWP